MTSTVDQVFAVTAKEQYDHWVWCYSEGNGQANKVPGRRAWHKPDLDYDTDRIIDRSTDRQLLEAMGVPQQFHRRLWGDGIPQEVLDWVLTLPWAQRPSYERQDEMPEVFGKGLVLYGPPNTGKSTLAAELLLRLVRMKFRNTDPSLRAHGWHGAMTGRWFDWQECSGIFREAARGEEQSDVAEELENVMMGGGKMGHGLSANWMVVDDLSRERVTEFNIGTLQRILRHRGNKGLTSIITTNTPPSAWEQTYGEVLASYLERQNTTVEVRR